MVSHDKMDVAYSNMCSFRSEYITTSLNVRNGLGNINGVEHLYQDNNVKHETNSLSILNSLPHGFSISLPEIVQQLPMI